MMSRFPSLRSVAVFVAAGRALSFTEAARAVNLTPSAVSRRMSGLERELGVALFRRFNRRLELTRAGQRYLAATSQAIDLIARESEAIRPRRQRTTLRLSVLQSFASTWLVPRLAVLKARRPDLDVEVETSAELVDLGDDRFDAAIRFGKGHWPGLRADNLFEVRVFPVAAPPVRRRGITAAALDRTVLLGVAQAPDLWSQYLSGVGLSGYRPRRTQSFDNAQVMFEGGQRAGHRPRGQGVGGGLSVGGSTCRALLRRAGAAETRLLPRLPRRPARRTGPADTAQGVGDRRARSDALTSRDAVVSAFVRRTGEPLASGNPFRS